MGSFGGAAASTPAASRIFMKTPELIGKDVRIKFLYKTLLPVSFIGQKNKRLSRVCLS